MGRLPLLVRALALAGPLAIVATACGSADSDRANVLGERIVRSGAVEAPASTAAEGAVPAAGDVPLAPAVPVVSHAPEPTAEDHNPVAEQAAPPPVATETVTLELHVESTTVTSGDDIRGTLVARNAGDALVDISHPDQCETVQGLYAGDTLVSEAQACAMAARGDSLAPGETRTWVIRIRTGAAAPGDYEVRAGLNLEVDRFAPGVRVTLT